MSDANLLYKGIVSCTFDGTTVGIVQSVGYSESDQVVPVWNQGADNVSALAVIAKLASCVISFQLGSDSVVPDRGSKGAVAFSAKAVDGSTSSAPGPFNNMQVTSNDITVNEKGISVATLGLQHCDDQDEGPRS